MAKQQKLKTRLRPIYVASFFIGLVFWYPIEKVFMRQIGYNDAQIGLVLTLIGVTMLVAGIPSGIIADRWSRKKVLMIAVGFLGFSALWGGLSTNIWMYGVLAFTWGMFYALYDGIFSSMIYDTLLEEVGKTDDFAKYYGRIQIFDSAALITGSLVSIAMVRAWSLNSLYFASVPSAIIAIVALAVFREPILHEKNAQTIRSRAKDIGIFLRQRGRVGWIIASLFMIVVMQRAAFEFYQLWLIALAVPLVFYGPVAAMTQSSIGLGGVLAPRLANKRIYLLVFTLLMVIAGFATTIRNPFIAILGLVFLLIGAFTLAVVMDQYLHRELSSHIRASGMSIAGTLGEIGFFVVAPLIGIVSHRYSPFASGWVLALVAAGIAISVYKVAKTGSAPEISSLAAVEQEQYQK